jgi:ribonuclease HI
MELQAVLEALKALDGPLLIQTDSSYVIGVFTGWLADWKSKNKLHKKENTDLILAIDRLLQGRQVRFEKVPAHSGHLLNEQADALANAAADAFAPPDQQPASERASRNGRPAQPPGFAAKFAGTCGNCATRYPPGVQITRNNAGKWVHAGGCPLT